MKKILHGAIPALLIHFSIGTVYCWSIFSNEISNYIGVSNSLTEWAFSLAIFFLGMSAAFLGDLVEKNIHKASLLSLICFCSGMIGTGFFIYLGGNYNQHGVHSLLPIIGIYISYGVIMGIGLGVGYITPVKTLMLWFKNNKGLATGIAVMGFGAAKAIASPIMLLLMNKLSNVNSDTGIKDCSGLYKMFILLGVVYMCLMFIAHILLKKPEEGKNLNANINNISISEVLNLYPKKDYIGVWIIFYLNITCGLALISQEKMIVKCIGLISFIGIISILSSIFNASGRLFLAMLGDVLKNRKTVYKIIFFTSALSLCLVLFTGGIYNNKPFIFHLLVLNALFIINAGYGGGFSNIAPLLFDYYGVKCISKLHGITLSAWAFAGLSGNQLASFILIHTGKFIKDNNGNIINPDGYNNLFIVLMILFLISLLITCSIYKKQRR